jgi:restriction endonuclease S subunit
MSFGRPYILNVDGCIHDGWLVLSDIYNVFDKEYLFYILSSQFVFCQFSEIVSGAVVNNLNSDKVAVTVAPVPPIDEQKRIVARIEELFELVNLLSSGKKIKFPEKEKDIAEIKVIANNVITQSMFDIESVGLAARAGDNIDDETINEAKRQVQAFYEKKN